METFYRHMRKRQRVLIDGPDKPADGQWNLEANNRKPWQWLTCKRHVKSTW
jgi:deoxyribodipyrimidine photolyase-related protein